VRHLFALLLLPLVAVAAPVPKEKPETKIKRLYGEIADAKKGYDFTLDGDKLVVTMGPSVSESLEEKTPPRVEREVKGDFEVRVAVTLAPPPATGTDTSVGFITGGLGLWAEDGRCLTFGPAIDVKAGGVACGNFRRELTSPRQKEWGCRSTGTPSDASSPPTTTASPGVGTSSHWTTARTGGSGSPLWCTNSPSPKRFASA